jgi:NADPH:quinone reductase-like Zn-dependent oxidoreductase
MKVIVQDTYGSPGVLKLRDIDKPQIGDEEVWYTFTRLAWIGGCGIS